MTGFNSLTTVREKVVYKDDGIKIPGTLVKKPFKKAVFVPDTFDCGFTKQTITKSEQKNVIK